MTGTQLSAREAVPKLLEQLLDLAEKIDGGRRSPFLSDIEDRTDQIATLVAAHILPNPKFDWPLYGLTVLEIRFAQHLLTHIGKWVSKEAIMSALYYDSVNDEPELKIVDVLVCKMRRKLRDAPYRIETKWGYGYKLIETAPAVEEKPVVLDEAGAVADRWQLSYGLTRCEAEMAELMFLRLGRTVSAEALRTATKDKVKHPKMKAVHVRIHHIRRKLAASPYVVVRSFGVGYVMQLKPIQIAA